MLARAAAAELMLAEFGGLLRGSLSVCASQTISGYWLPRHLADYRRAYPGIELRLTVGNTAQVAAAVYDGTAELGFVEGAVSNPALLSEVVARDQLVLVVGMDHPWAGRARVELAELAEIEWVLREPGSGTRSVFEAELARTGMAPVLRIALELPSNEAVRAAVEAGAGAVGRHKEDCGYTSPLVSVWKELDSPESVVTPSVAPIREVLHVDCLEPRPV